MTTNDKDANTHRISSCNGCHPISVEKQVYNFIDHSPIEVSPKEISLKTGLNHNSVKSAVRRLLLKNKVVQPYPNRYINRNEYGVRFVPLMVHNVRLKCCVAHDIKHFELTEVVGEVKVYVCFGSERRQVSGFIACDRGMSRDACLLAMHRWFDLVEGKLGYSPQEYLLQSFEVNKDYEGIRLDGGLKCITKKGLFDVIERTYQKEENVVRHEHKVSKSMTVNEFEALLQGGVPTFNVVQSNFAVMKQVEALTEALKFTNGRLLEQGKLLEAITKTIIQIKDGKYA
jgi:hypothetical protein